MTCKKGLRRGPLPLNSLITEARLRHVPDFNVAGHLILQYFADFLHDCVLFLRCAIVLQVYLLLSLLHFFDVGCTEKRDCENREERDSEYAVPLKSRRQYKHCDDYCARYGVESEVFICCLGVFCFSHLRSPLLGRFSAGKSTPLVRVVMEQHAWDFSPQASVYHDTSENYWSIAVINSNMGNCSDFFVFLLWKSGFFIVDIQNYVYILCQDVIYLNNKYL